jgi:hypothetical protein
MIVIGKKTRGGEFLLRYDRYRITCNVLPVAASVRSRTRMLLEENKSRVIIKLIQWYHGNHILKWEKKLGNLI